MQAPTPLVVVAEEAVVAAVAGEVAEAVAGEAAAEVAAQAVLADPVLAAVLAAAMPAVTAAVTQVASRPEMVRRMPAAVAVAWAAGVATRVQPHQAEVSGLVWAAAMMPGATAAPSPAHWVP
ncbi:hypothetical protein [Roseomonas rosulenta]|uniref:hypothetical protein n=1 Tax=Roseomonas rosulenta TaxID=2748667 RepID=UPI0018DF3C0F|nr:hypothetical protein [Roseomonas rosulenta]